MISRRRTLASLASLPVTSAVSMSSAGANDQPVHAAVPTGACDTHVHVIGDPRRFPMAFDRETTPPGASAAQLRDLLDAEHLDRVVIIAAAAYGADYSATIDAVGFLGQRRARAVVWLPEDRSDTHLKTLKMAGTAGFRVLLDRGGGLTTLFAKLRTRINIAARWGWHMDIAAPPDMIEACLPKLGSSPVPIVLDTFGWIEGGLRQQGVDAVLSLVGSGVAYVKLSEPYRLSDNSPDYPDLKPVAEKLVATNPGRILWGSGWPHVSSPIKGRAATDITPNLPIDTRHLLDLLATWVPDANTRHRILVENPALLYGFGDT